MINFFDFKREKCFLSHSISMTFFSPLSSLYQITQLYNLDQKRGLVKLHNSPFVQNIKYIPRIFPQQVLLRYGQLHLSTLCKQQEEIPTVVAFGIIGILQGVVYGHSNLYFSKKLNILNKDIKITKYFRGPAFAASRDIISQGLPYALTEKVSNHLFKNKASDPFYHYGTLFTLSTLSTFLSHPLHCFQVFAQNETGKSHYQIAKQAIKLHRWSLFYKGIEARLILLGLTNFFNDMFLKDVWSTET